MSEPVLDDCEAVLTVEDIGALTVVTTSDRFGCVAEMYLAHSEARKLESMLRAKREARAAQGGE